MSQNGAIPETAARQMRLAMRLSLAFGVVMLVGKVAAYLFTGSAAILSDAAESVVHLVAVIFAWFSLWLSLKPANQRYLYGYERIAFFSAGFEGAMIVLAAIFIIAATVQKWIAGLQLENVGAGTLVAVAAAVVNAGLGWYLIRTGKRTRSLILEADGKHVLTDSWTSFGVVAGLGLVLCTGWKPWDAICAIAVALNILWSGGHLIWRSATGLLDTADPQAGTLLREKLDALCEELGVQYHGVRFRSTGHRLLVEVHLLFAGSQTVAEAHRLATLLEERLSAALGQPAEVITHLEASDDHQVVHRAEHYTGKPGPA
ncbi:MAG TPA: cation diffusion facilitator family transporter [Bryobacteraceae bacterium]|nr:cation diffusion facilitator family transporter [Bryobacteraceae bacterium]